MPTMMTTREAQVYGLLGRGRTYAQIAADMGISPKTVDAHLAHLAMKAGMLRRELRTMAIEDRVRMA